MRQSKEVKVQTYTIVKDYGKLKAGETIKAVLDRSASGFFYKTIDGLNVPLDILTPGVQVQPVSVYSPMYLNRDFGLYKKGQQIEVKAILVGRQIYHYETKHGVKIPVAYLQAQPIEKKEFFQIQPKVVKIKPEEKRTPLRKYRKPGEKKKLLSKKT